MDNRIKCGVEFACWRGRSASNVFSSELSPLPHQALMLCQRLRVPVYSKKDCFNSLTLAAGNTRNLTSLHAPQAHSARHRLLDLPHRTLHVGRVGAGRNRHHGRRRKQLRRDGEASPMAFDDEGSERFDDLAPLECVVHGRASAEFWGDLPQARTGLERHTTLLCSVVLFMLVAIWQQLNCSALWVGGGET